MLLMNKEVKMCVQGSTTTECVCTMLNNRRKFSAMLEVGDGESRLAVFV